MGGGGAERQLSYISNEMFKSGQDVHVAYFQDGPNIKRLNIPKENIHHLSCLNNYDPMIIYKLVKTIRKINPHIVQTWMPQIDILAGVASILTRTPFILSERSSPLAYGHGWKDRFRIIIGKKADAIIANSKEGIDYWINKINKPALKVIRNGIPFDEIYQVPKFSLSSQQIDESKEIILFAGRYDKPKNLYNLLTALQQVLKEREQTIVFFFGRGPQKETLINLNKKDKNSDRIKIMDYSDELWSWFKVADVFVSISDYEGNPNTVLEAVASKCPVVISDIPGHREFLNEESSWLVPGFNTKAIAQGVIKALSDPPNARCKAENAYNKVKDWSINSVVKEYISFYKLILKKR
jgi:glycosyltransferase involved in cell wall biosynthesis